MLINSTHLNLKYGPRSGMELSDFLQERGYSYVGVVVDAGLMANPYFVEMYKFLTQRAEVVQQLVNEVSEPTYDYLDHATKEFRNKNLDCLVVIGGGSTMDLAKGISVLLTNPGPGISYRGVNKIKVPGVPLVLLPSTAGTGSEVTSSAPFIDTKENKKQGISTAFYHPELVILDPLLVASCPKSVSVAAGMDALVHHAIDAYISGGKGNPICAIFAKEAFSLLFNALPRAVENPQDLNWRGETQLGSLYAGLALANGGGGSIAGAMSYPLGVHFKVPHGMAVAICSRETIRFNVERGYQGYEEFNNLIQNGVWSGSVFFQNFSRFFNQLDIPSLSKFGVREEHFPDLAEEVSAMSVVNRNPIPVSKDDIIAILRSCL